MTTFNTNVHLTTVSETKPWVKVSVTWDWTTVKTHHIMMHVTHYFHIQQSCLLCHRTVIFIMSCHFITSQAAFLD